jgi:hypothetical protein
MLHFSDTRFDCPISAAIRASFNVCLDVNQEVVLVDDPRGDLPDKEPIQLLTVLKLPG